MTARAVLFAAFLLARPSTAATAPPVSGDSEEPVARVDRPPPGTGYHLQMLAVDAASITTAITGFAVEANHYNPRVSDVLVGAGMGGYVLGGPIVHLAHRQYGRAGISLALRVGLPIVGGLVGLSTATCHPDEWLCGVGELAAGFAIGSAAAVVIDNAFIVPSGHSTVDAGPVAATARPSAALRIAPRLVAAPNVAVFGVGGQF